MKLQNNHNNIGILNEESLPGVKSDSAVEFNELNIKDKPIFDTSLSFKTHNLSAYAFENIFIWKGLYKIFWTKINDNICVFFKDRIGCFLYLPPLGRNIDSQTVKKCFDIMEGYNHNRIISRIENVERPDLGFYQKLGLMAVLGGNDYICQKSDLVNLKGNIFKSKRAAVNYFTRNYKFIYEPYRNFYKEECLALFKAWAKERNLNNKDTIYQRLLEDNFSVFKKVLDCYGKLDFVGKIIKVDGKIQAVSFGYPLGRHSFVVLFEVCNLKFKGIAQYIFREFSREQPASDINIMDDSSLESLRKVKLSYQPYKTVENFVIRNA